MAGPRILVTTDAVGGVWTYAVEMCAGLAGQGFSPVLAVVGPAPSAAQRAHVAAHAAIETVVTGLPLDWTARDPGTVRRAADGLAALARDRAVDLALLHAPAFAAARWPVPAVAVHHSCQATWWQAVRPGQPIPEALAWRRDCVAEGMAAADAVIAPTAVHARAVASAYGLERPPRCIHNGRHVAANLATGRNALFVLAAGRLWDEGKNLAMLDEAAGRLCAPLLAAGPLHSPWGSVPLVHGKALGPMDEAAMRHWMARAPVFASVALYEPFGYCVLEAAQSGCALVLSDTPGFRELWDGAAVFVPPRDPHAIAEALNRLLFDEAGAARLGRAARVRSGRYTASRMVRQTAALLHEVAGRGRRGAAA